LTQTGVAYDENTKAKFHERIDLWAKSIEHFGNFGRHFLALYPQKSTQHVRACAAHDGAICSKNRIIVPYHGDSPNTRNGARLRSPSPIMAPGVTPFKIDQNKNQNRSTDKVQNLRKERK